MPSFQGLAVATITPFTEKGELDLEAFKWLAEGLVEAGVQGLWVAGTTGEWTSLGLEERKLLFQVAVEAAGGKARVFAGVASLRLEEALEAARIAGDLGVDYVFSTPPLYFKPSRRRLLEYYEKLSRASGKPVFIYNIPGNVGYGVSVEEVEWMALEQSSVAGVKATLSDYTYVGRLVRRVKSARRDFSILVGSEELLLHNLSIGGDGAVSALANLLPLLPLSLYQAWLRGDFPGLVKAAVKIQEARGLIEELGAPLLLSVKGLMSSLGGPFKPVVRSPLDGDLALEGVLDRLCNRLGEYLHPYLRC